MGKESFMPLFVGDFLASTAEWPGGARGLYLNLLMHQWAIGSLPFAARSLQELCKMTANEWRQYWPIVAAKFERRGDRLYNVRLEEHRNKAKAISDKRAHVGKAGAVARWHKDSSQLPSAPDSNCHTFAMPSNPIHTREELRKDKTPHKCPPIHDANVSGVNGEPFALSDKVPVAKRRKAATMEPVDYPPELCRDAWAKWTNYRTQIRKPLKLASLTTAMKRQMAIGDFAAQLAAVENSIANGYTGLFAAGGADSAKFAGQRKSYDDRVREAFLNAPERKTE